MTTTTETPGGQALTAYPRAEGALRHALQHARFDAASLARPLTRCSLATCRGMCCYDGVYVDAEAAEILTDLARREGAFFRRLGLALPDEVIVDGAWEGLLAGQKTAVVPHPFATEVAGYPPHFDQSACVFHLGDGRCALQLLSVERGRHPWYYKPFTCWQHPLSVVPVEDEEGAASAVILLESEATDPYRVPGYDGYVPQTFCGRTATCGRPAHEVLAEELAHLGAIAGRDLTGALRSGAGAPAPAASAPD